MSKPIALDGVQLTKQFIKDYRLRGERQDSTPLKQMEARFCVLGEASGKRLKNGRWEVGDQAVCVY